MLGGEVMLTNLEEARQTKGVSLVDIADLLKVRRQTISDKISGLYDFKFDEALTIRDSFFPEYTLEYLFKKNEKN